MSELTFTFETVFYHAGLVQHPSGTQCGAGWTGQGAPSRHRDAEIIARRAIAGGIDADHLEPVHSGRGLTKTTLDIPRDEPMAGRNLRVAA